MNYGENGLSASDVALLTGSGRNGNGDCFGAGGAWLVVLFLLFGMFGYGENGSLFGNKKSGAADNYVLASDFATLQRQIDSATNTLERKSDATQQGLCDGFYAMNTGMLNGFNGIQQTLCQGFSGVNSNINTTGYETRNAINGISAQLSDCCCQTQRAIDGVNYNLATNTCAITNNATQNTRDIIDAVNANYRSLHDELIANRIEDKNAQIQAQQNEINSLRLRASQEAQNNYLISQLKPCPDPAYIVPNPNCCYNYTVSQNGCGCGC